MKEFLSALLVIGFVIWLFMDQPLNSRFTGERNIYPMTCQNDVTNWAMPTDRSFFTIGGPGISCPKGSKPRALFRKSYIANQERQQVVELDIETGNVRRYDNCEVYDADNWSCNHTGLDIGKSISMHDGKMLNDALPFVYVSKIKWYWYEWAK